MIVIYLNDYFNTILITTIYYISFLFLMWMKVIRNLYRNNLISSLQIFKWFSIYMYIILPIKFIIIKIKRYKYLFVFQWMVVTFSSHITLHDRTGALFGDRSESVIALHLSYPEANCNFSKVLTSSKRFQTAVFWFL